jgi:hypothetical protein
MRMGNPDKKRRGDTSRKTKTAGHKSKPKYCSAASVVGQLSPDFISTYFAPELMGLATESLERYNDEIIQYQDLLSDFENQKNGTEEVEIDVDGTTRNTMEPPKYPTPPIYKSEYWVNELEEVIKDTSDFFHAKNGGWKVHVKAAKFERQLDEKYGIFRPFVTNHPEIEQFVRSMQRKYAMGHFSPLRQGKPPIPRSTAVIILFMMKRGNMRWDILTLAALFFLIGLQPWALVIIVATGHTLLEGRRKKPISPMGTKIPAVEPYYRSSEDEASSAEDDDAKRKMLLKPVGSDLEDGEMIDTSKYDTIIIGSGPSPLYTASLLSRAGRKVLVLSPRNDASGCFVIEGAKTSTMEKFMSVPFDIESSNIAKISRQQKLLAPALSTSSDYQGGIRFAQIGTDADGHAFEILSVPGMGTDGNGTEIPFILRAAGARSLMDDAAQFLGDGWPGINGEVGNSTSGAYVNVCEAINATSNQLFLTKMLSDKVNDMRSNGVYQESAIRYASAFLDKSFPFNAHTRSLMAAIGMKAENIKPSMTSMGAQVTNICSAMSGEGMYYPIGGPRALCHALASVVEQNGGRVVTNAQVTELLFEPEKSTTEPKVNSKGEPKEGIAPRCIGVKLSDNREIKFDLGKLKNASVAPAIISTLGFVNTFIRLLPDDIRGKHKVPRGLPALSERRPVIKALFALNGTAEELNVTGADFYRVPGAALAQDEIDPVSGQINLGEIGWSDDVNDGGEVAVDEINEETSDNPQSDSGGSRDKRTKSKRPRRNKFDAGLSWIQISFPSAKDPSFESRHGKITTCVVTIEADDDFVTPFDTKPKLFAIQKGRGPDSGECQRLMERLKRDLLEIYPQLDGE